MTASSPHSFLESPSRAQGFSLVEVLLVVGVIALLAIAVFIVYASVQQKNNVLMENNRLVLMLANIKQTFGGVLGYADLTTDLANQSRVFPVSMNGNVYLPGTVINNIWAGTVEVFSQGESAFSIRYSGVPSDACVKFIPDMASRFSLVTVDGVAVRDVPAGLGVSGFDLPSMLTACNANDPVVIEWYGP